MAKRITAGVKRRRDAACAKKYRVRYRLVYVRGVTALRYAGDRINPGPAVMGYFDRSTDSLSEALTYMHDRNAQEEKRAGAIKSAADYAGDYWRREYSVYENIGRDNEGLTIEIAVAGPDRSTTLSRPSANVSCPFIDPTPPRAVGRHRAEAHPA